MNNYHQEMSDVTLTGITDCLFGILAKLVRILNKKIAIIVIITSDIFSLFLKFLRGPFGNQ